MTPQMSLLLLLFCLFLYTSSQVLSQQNECPEPPQPLITGDMYRVEDDQLMASSIYSSDYDLPDVRVGVGANSWCSDESDTELWFQVDFNEDVVIHTLQMGGDGGLFQYYINSFRIEHGSNSNQLRSVLWPNSTSPMIFTREDTPNVVDMPLTTPLTTRVLRIVTETYTGSVPCLFLEVLGCPLTTEPTSTPPETTSPQGDVTTTLVSTGSVGASTGVIVGGAMGGVIVLVLILLVMVLALGCILAKNRSGKTRSAETEVTYSPAEGEVRIVDNNIYGEDSPPTNPTIHFSKQPDSNAQYESLKTSRTNAIDMVDTYGTPKVNANSSTPYETVGSPPVYTYVTVNTPIKVVLPGNNRSEEFNKDTIVSPNIAYGSSLTDNEAETIMSSEFFNEEIIVSPNAAYGSSLEDNEAYNIISSDLANEETIVSPNAAYGSSLVDNEAYNIISSELANEETIVSPNAAYGSSLVDNDAYTVISSELEMSK